MVPTVGTPTIGDGDMGWRKQRGGEPGGEAKRRGPGRFLFYFMGPPEVGDVNAPRSAPLPTVEQTCVSCGRPMKEHVIDRAHGKSATRCPS